MWPPASLLLAQQEFDWMYTLLLTLAEETYHIVIVISSRSKIMRFGFKCLQRFYCIFISSNVKMLDNCKHVFYLCQIHHKI